jgi:hypothetical protein
MPPVNTTTRTLSSPFDPAQLTVELPEHHVGDKVQWRVRELDYLDRPLPANSNLVTHRSFLLF